VLLSLPFIVLFCRGLFVLFPLPFIVDSFYVVFWDLPSVDYPRVPSHPPLSIGLLGFFARITLGPLRVVL
jgi:hypothetical protein